MRIKKFLYQTDEKIIEKLLKENPAFALEYCEKGMSDKQFKEAASRRTFTARHFCSDRIKKMNLDI